MDRAESIADYSGGPRAGPVLPDFCNLGTWLRTILAVNAFALAVASARGRELAALAGEFTQLAALVEPPLLAGLLLMCVLRRQLAALPPRRAVAAVVLLTGGIAATTSLLLAPALGLDGPASALRAFVWAGLAAALMLAWFDLSARARSPAVVEARLMALTARIRPHFLFNSLNAVLGVIRSDPRRAERAIEELSDLFRVLMRENRDLVPLSDEIALGRQYLELERLRLGDRLQVRWQIEDCPPDALVPPLMLQPLLENAVYHGIEPLQESGEIVVRLRRARDRISIELNNPCGGKSAHAGNRMALANIRERLRLFFDLEAELTTETDGSRYRVIILLPYRSQERK